MQTACTVKIVSKFTPTMIKRYNAKIKQYFTTIKRYFINNKTIEKTLYFLYNDKTINNLYVSLQKKKQ